MYRILLILSVLLLVLCPVTGEISLSFTETFFYDSIDGFNDGFGFRHDVDLSLFPSSSAGLFIHLKDINQNSPVNMGMTWDQDIIDFFGLKTGYVRRLFDNFDIDEHNIYLLPRIQWNFTWVFFRLSAGGNVKITDYFGDLLEVEIFFPYILLVSFISLKIWQASIEIGNGHFDIPMSQGYLELRMLNRFSISQNLSLLLNLGIGYSGLMAVAGLINRQFYYFGVKYEF